MIRRTFLLLCFVFFALLFGCVVVILQAPVGELRNKKEYRPLYSQKTRITGLKAREILSLDDVSPALIVSVISSEDSQFYTHAGFDPDAILRSIKNYLFYKKPLTGASTITQQLVKNVYFSPERSWYRKVLELLYAIKLEAEYTKEEILTMYLHVAQFGKDLYGIKAASDWYFRKSPSDLSIAESAFLASILPSPLRYSAMAKEAKLPHKFHRSLVFNQMVSHMVLDSFLEEPATPSQILRISFLHFSKKQRERSAANLILMKKVKRDTHELLLDLKLHSKQHKADRQQRLISTYSIEQAQSHLSSYLGKPLLSASFGGHYQPYIYDRGELRPLLGERTDSFASVDFYKPVELAGGKVLSVGSEKGKRNFDLYIFVPGSGEIRNITGRDAIDDGHYCVSPGGTSFAFRSGKKFEIRRAEDPQRTLAVFIGAAFHACSWIDDRSFLAIKSPWNNPTLYYCSVSGRKLSCRITTGLDRFDDVLTFVQKGSHIGVVGRKKDDQWQRIYLLRKEWTQAEQLPSQEQQQDYLDYQDKIFRYGKGAYYWLSGVENKEDIISRHRLFGSELFAIAANGSQPRTLARRVGDRWQYLYPKDFEMPKDAPAVSEHWIDSKGMEGKYQLFEFGDYDTHQDAILWLHGGPHENVSPRYKGYFHALHDAGYVVYALNYPGSTGQGKSYEERFRPENLADATSSVLEWLSLKRKMRSLSVWSISTGGKVARLMIGRELPVNGYVEQVGGNQQKTIELALDHGADVFIVRGKYDRLVTEEGVDYLYDGGHDIVLQQQHRALMSQVLPYLSNLRIEG